MQTNANSAKQERNMGVELLRIVSMLMVVILHILGQGGVLAGVEDAPDSARYAATYLLESGAYMAVNCYALISGYVGAEHPFRYARLFEMQARVLFYTVFITAGFCIALPELFGVTLLKNAVFPAMTGQYWYYTAYFGLMLFLPALQCMVAHLSKVQFRNLVVGTVLLFSVLPMLFVSDLFQTAQGYSLLWLAALYLIGAYLKKYGLPFLTKPLPAFLVYLLSVLAAWGIQTAEARGSGIPLPNQLVYTSPAMLLAGVSLLTAFAALRLPAPVRKAAAVCAPLSFSVYLIHAHPLVWTHLFEGRFASLAALPFYGLVPAVIGAAAAIYAVCALIDAVRAWLFRVIRVRAGCERLEARMKGFLEGRAGGS
ncbi:MAG: acyltransferase [Clostridium sp.]|nr:acyltransferase [Clostridium sp.]